jgi:hypothetical protein
MLAGGPLAQIGFLVVVVVVVVTGEAVDLYRTSCKKKICIVLLRFSGVNLI